MNKKEEKKIFSGNFEVKWLPEISNGLNEIYSSGWQCAFLSPNNEQCHKLVRCKDFLHDAVHAFLHEKTASIYGFKYTPKEYPPLDLTIDYYESEEIDPKTNAPKLVPIVSGRTRLVVGNQKDANFLETVPKVLDFVHQFEERLGLDNTEAYLVNNPPEQYKNGMVVYVSSSRWQEAPPMISLYSLLLRIGCVHVIGQTWSQTLNDVIQGKIKPYQTNDASYLKSCISAIETIMRIGFRTIFFKDPKKNYVKDIDIGTLHGSGGIVAYAQGFKMVKYWHRKELQNKPSLDERKILTAK